MTGQQLIQYLSEKKVDLQKHGAALLQVLTPYQDTEVPEPILLAIFKEYLKQDASLTTSTSGSIPQNTPGKIVPSKEAELPFQENEDYADEVSREEFEDLENRVDVIEEGLTALLEDATEDQNLSQNVSTTQKHPQVPVSLPPVPAPLQSDAQTNPLDSNDSKEPPDVATPSQPVAQSEEPSIPTSSSMNTATTIPSVPASQPSPQDQKEIEEVLSEIRSIKKGTSSALNDQNTPMSNADPSVQFVPKAGVSQ